MVHAHIQKLKIYIFLQEKLLQHLFFIYKILIQN